MSLFKTFRYPNHSDYHQQGMLDMKCTALCNCKSCCNIYTDEDVKATEDDDYENFRDDDWDDMIDDEEDLLDNYGI